MHTTYSLPDGRKISVSSDESGWPKVSQTGFVPIEAVLSDPNQPRNTEGIEHTPDHREFAQSVRMNGQGMIVPVTELTDEERRMERAKNPLARYRIVDGERRSHAVGKKGANLGVIEITVLPPLSPEERHLRQVVLNTMQKPLQGPDLVRALIRIKRDFSLSVNELAVRVNMSQPTVNDLLHLEKLSPKLLKLTDKDKYPKKTHLATKPAVALSRIEAGDGMTAHQRQEHLFAEAQKRNITGAVQLVSFFEQYHTEEVRKRSERRWPSRKRNRIGTLFGILSRSDLVRMDEQGLRTVMSTASPNDISKLISEGEKALAAMSFMLNVLREIPKQGQTAEDVPPRGAATQQPPPTKQVSVSERRPVPTVVRVPFSGTVPRTSIDQARPRQSSHTETMVRERYEAEPPAPRPPTPSIDWIRNGSLHLDASYFDPSVGRMVFGTVTSLENMKIIWSERRFKWQRNNVEKPASFPTLEEVENTLRELIKKRM